MLGVKVWLTGKGRVSSLIYLVGSAQQSCALVPKNKYYRGRNIKKHICLYELNCILMYDKNYSMTKLFHVLDLVKEKQF